jgi:hypothetical protein
MAMLKPSVWTFGNSQSQFQDLIEGSGPESSSKYVKGDTFLCRFFVNFRIRHLNDRVSIVIEVDCLGQLFNRFSLQVILPS